MIEIIRQIFIQLFLQFIKEGDLLGKAELFIFRKADQVLKDKGLYWEIKSILDKIKWVDYKEIRREFQGEGWKIERRIHPSANWVWDAYKRRVAVSIELSLIDAVHTDFFRAILAHKHKDLDVLVYVSSTFKEPMFHNVKRDIEIFKELLIFPILLIGLT
jgi:hypothetical protein